MEKKKILVVGDGVTPTGFSRVTHNIIRNLPKDKFEIHHLAINYYGDPHKEDWLIYPAAIGGDLWGFNRLKEFLNKDSKWKWDGIFILNDVWVIQTYLEKLKELELEKYPPIITYFPVDSLVLDETWFQNFDLVKKTVVYTQFGYDQVKLVREDLDVNIIPHGVDTKDFYKIEGTKEEIKAKLLPNKDEFIDSFIVLNANRNQPRKRIDLTIEGFALFAQDKPENVKLYLHTGVRDVGIDIYKIARRYGVDKRLIVTNEVTGVQRVPIETLNLIYNSTDVGINTSTGEGWGLTNHEHAATGAPQVVPNHSACKELYQDCGSLVPIHFYLTNNDTLTIGGFVHPQHIAYELDKLYTDKLFYQDRADKCYNKFTSDDYKWENIANKYWIPLFEEIYS